MGPPEAAAPGWIGARLVESSVAVPVRVSASDFAIKNPADRAMVPTALEAGARFVAGERQILDRLDDALAR